MNRIIRQAFGTTRPKDIYLNLMTFDRMVMRPIVHIVYWVGLGLLVIAAMAVAGTAVGEAIKEGMPWGFVLALPLLIVGWLMILIAALLWRSFCEFYMAVMNIADDLRYLRQHQEKLSMPQAAPVTAPETAPESAIVPSAFDSAATVGSSEATQVVQGSDVVDAPFFQPRFGKQP